MFGATEQLLLNKIQKNIKSKTVAKCVSNVDRHGTHFLHCHIIKTYGDISTLS
jgi:hypothetical protein